MATLFEIVKEQYVWEAQRRDKLNSSASIPIGFATLSSTVLTTIFSRLSQPFDWVEWTLMGLLVFSIVSGIAFLYQTVRFFMGPIYKYVADSASIVEFWKSSNEYYKRYPRAGSIDEKFDDFLLETYSTCATVNCRNNDLKSSRLYLMNRWVLTMLVPCLLAALMLGFAQIFQNQEGSLKVMAESERKDVPPPPPPPPPERSIKDGANVQLPKPK